MLQYVHGGDIQTYIDRHGFAPLDLSANINPFGIPDAVRAAMHRAVDNCTQYPDPFCRAARQAIGAKEGVNPDFLYCGNGAADVLDRLAAVLKPRKVLLTAPTFAEYERTLSGAEIRVHNLRETDGFALTERIFDEISPDLDAVYLCNPNNPTGRSRGTCRSSHRRAPSRQQTSRTGPLKPPNALPRNAGSYPTDLQPAD